MSDSHFFPQNFLISVTYPMGVPKPQSCPHGHEQYVQPHYQVEVPSEEAKPWSAKFRRALKHKMKWWIYAAPNQNSFGDECLWQAWPVTICKSDKTTLLCLLLAWLVSKRKDTNLCCIFIYSHGSKWSLYKVHHRPRNDFFNWPLVLVYSIM